MNTYQKELIKEHAELVVRTKNLHDYVYSEAYANEHCIEFANKCIQLSSMKKYEEALRARIENTGIVFEDGQYFEKVGDIRVNSLSAEMPSAGNDFDADKENETPQGNTADE